MNKNDGKKKRKTKSRSHGRTACMMLMPGIAVILIFVYYPIIRGSLMAFQNYNLWNIFDRGFVGLSNFSAVVSSGDFGMIVRNTVIWVFVSLFFQFILGFLLAMCLKRRFPGSGLYQGIVYVPWAISGFLIGLIWRWLMNGQTGAINDILIRMNLIETPVRWLSDTKIALWSTILANIWYGIPFFAIMIQAALKGVPDDLYEAAEIDGCNSVKKFTLITLPFIKPVLVLTTLLRVIWILNFPDLIYTMTSGGPANSSHILTTYMLDLLYFNQDYGKASALSLIIMLILLSYAIFYLKFTKFEEAGDF